jgi:hypothetical protein
MSPSAFQPANQCLYPRKIMIRWAALLKPRQNLSIGACSPYSCLRARFTGRLRTGPMDTRMVIQKVLMTALDKIWAAGGNMGRRREGDGMLSLGFFDAANNRQSSWLIHQELTHFSVHCILSGRRSRYFRSCGAAGKWGLGSAASELFHLW